MKNKTEKPVGMYPKDMLVLFEGLYKHTFDFLHEYSKFHKEMYFFELIDIIMSAHISSMVSCIRGVSKMSDDPDAPRKMEKFIKKLNNFFEQELFLEKIKICDISKSN